MKSGSSQEGPLFCHKILTKKCRKPLDFCSRDEYNTLSTQRNGVLNTGSKENESFRAKKVYHYIKTCIINELSYYEAKDVLKLPAQDAREYLPLGIKSEIYYTGFNEDWNNIIDKRLYDKFGKSHPNMHIIMKRCKDHLDVIRDS